LILYILSVIISTKEWITMPNIKPISDLRNYTEVLKEVSFDNPVYLTKNGRGEYAIVKLQELDQLKATVRLMAKLEEGEKSAREGGWLSADDVEATLGL
jgi:prevent-host-death family protein